MTSKEALNQLYILADTPELAMVVQSYYNIVEKDLEVLEILKRLFITAEDEEYPSLYLDKRYKLYTGKCENLYSIETNGYDYGSLYLTENEYNAIKRWLNDRPTSN